MTVADLSDFASQRQTMVDCQIRTFDVTDQDVIARFMDVPREKFLPAAMQPLLHWNCVLMEQRAQCWHHWSWRA